MMNYVDFLYNWVENLDYSLKKLKYKHTELKLFCIKIGGHI